jgi:hypothetical protein
MALARCLSLARTLQKVHALPPDPGECCGIAWAAVEPNVARSCGKHRARLHQAVAWFPFRQLNLKDRFTLRKAKVAWASSLCAVHENKRTLRTNIDVESALQSDTGWKPGAFGAGPKGRAPEGLEHSARVSTLGIATQSDAP